MNTSKIDLSSRVSLRAVAAGVLVTFSAMLLSMLLAGGVGIWGFELTKISRMGTAFWVWSFVSWALALYASGYLCSVISRSSSQLDGAIHGVAAWAASCALGSLFVLYFVGNPLAGLPESAASPVLWGFFIADLTALGTAIVGGSNGALAEFKVEILEESVKRATPGPRLDHALKT